MQEVAISTEFIKLGQLLKLAGLVDQGSDSKIVIYEGLVELNNIKVTERGKKIRPGDIVNVKGKGTIKVIKS